MSEEDTRFVYGARCTFNGPIQNCGSIESNVQGQEVKLPCCPNCKGMLLEYPTRKPWDGQLKQFDAEKRYGGQYVRMWKWVEQEKKCYPQTEEGMRQMIEDYNKEAGGKMPLPKQ